MTHSCFTNNAIDTYFAIAFLFAIAMVMVSIAWYSYRRRVRN